MAGHIHTHTYTKEMGERYSASNRRRWADSEYRTNMIGKMPLAWEASLAVRQTQEYKEACRDGQNSRWSRQEERIAASERMSGDGNPRWNPDRPVQTARNEFILRVRIDFKKAKHGIFSGLLDYVWPELGYSSRQLKEYVELQFVDGMSWKNWGEWHIDHIFPVSKFDVTSSSIVVNALSNLRPLWKLDNLSKASKIIDEVRLR